MIQKSGHLNLAMTKELYHGEFRPPAMFVGNTISRRGLIVNKATSTVYGMHPWMKGSRNSGESLCQRLQNIKNTDGTASCSLHGEGGLSTNS